MSSSLAELEEKFSQAILSADTLERIDELNREFLGRKGLFNAILKGLSDLPPGERKKVGNEVNVLKTKIEARISEKKSEVERAKFEGQLKTPKEDHTLPGTPFRLGRTHPLTLVLDEVIEIFLQMGFDIAEGPEIESDELNFGALNIPAEHPARDMHDTFYIDPRYSILDSGKDPHKEQNPASRIPHPASRLLLRTHTSPVQIRVMRRNPPPIRIIAPGKVYRHEAVDATHSSVFHQIEGLVVDQSISFADLKGTLESFSRKFFGDNVKTRFRPSYFPFVEPGAEADISCTICLSQGRPENPDGSGAVSPVCPVCKGTGWIEMLGAGMVHPKVFEAVGYDPNQVTGFAFGLGIERIAMVRYGINDMRLFYENHLDFLEQF